MRTFLLTFVCIIAVFTAPAGSAEPFEIKDGDRVLFLGDTLLEREGTYGYLETRMVEQFPDRKFTVRNLAFSADTPLGWSRASFDPAAKGFERLKEQLALVKPTVVFLGYGMAASLQEMTDRSQDWTLNRDPARYGAEPMTAARFKKELAQCMDAIVEVSAKESGVRDQESGKNAPDGEQRASGSAGVPPAGSGVSPEPLGVERTPHRDTPSTKERNSTPDGPRETRGPAGGTPALPEARHPANPTVRFVLLSPIRHEDLRATRPGLPDPSEHNKLLEQYSKAIEELAQERGALFVNLFTRGPQWLANDPLRASGVFGAPDRIVTENGIHLSEWGYTTLSWALLEQLPLRPVVPKGGPPEPSVKGGTPESRKREAKWRTESEALRAAIIRKNELFFHRWRPANETYLFGFRKREQGKNGAEIPMFDPLIQKAEAAIEEQKHSPIGLPLNIGKQKQRYEFTLELKPSPDGAEYHLDGKMHASLNGAIAELKKLRAAQPDKKLLLWTDKNLKYAHVKAVMTELRKIGVESVTVSADPTALDPDRQIPTALPLPTFTLADGLEIFLWAENPLLAKPTEMNWDAQGRLWVASSAMYPMIAPGQVASDKIIILEDPGHTGKATKSTVFVDGLLIPTGVAPVLVTRNAERKQTRRRRCLRFRAPRSAFHVRVLRRPEHRAALLRGHRRRRQGRQKADRPQRIWHRGHAPHRPHPALGAGWTALF